MKHRVNRRRRSAEIPLPPALEAAWGIHARPSRGPKPGLTLPQIADAAVELAGAEGLEAVSMSRVAGALGVATMSLYRYVRSKDELLMLMVDAVFARPPAAASPKRRWRAALGRWAREHLAVLRRHPWVVRVPISGPPTMPNQLVWFERGLECLRDTGLAERARISALLLVNGFVRNEALLRSDLEAAAGLSASDAMSSYGKLLGRLIDRQRFPSIAALVDSGTFEGSEPDDADFEFGLERILDGLASLLPARLR